MGATMLHLLVLPVHDVYKGGHSWTSSNDLISPLLFSNYKKNLYQFLWYEAIREFSDKLVKFYNNAEWIFSYTIINP